MKNYLQYIAPLAVHIVWNMADSEFVTPIVNRFVRSLTRDAQNSFSRGVTIPLFLYESASPNDVPCNLRAVGAKREVCFFFASAETAGRDSWRLYAEKMSAHRDLSIVPIALNREGLRQFGRINAIRYQDGDEDSRDIRCIISMLHEVLRYGFVDAKRNQIGNESSLKVFISHSKGDSGSGVRYAKKIREIISETNMSSFFDATEISPGRDFEKEIAGNLNRCNSSLVSFNTDSYASRYWCQREVLLAKKNRLPMVVVDCLDHWQDRCFPELSNVPTMRLKSDTDESYLEILLRILIEAIRCKFVECTLSEYKRVEWIPRNAELLIRPPEPSALICADSRHHVMLCYPEPPLYPEELAWLSKIGYEAYTPLQLNGRGVDIKSLRRRKIGISVSDVGDAVFENNLPRTVLKTFAQELARHLIARAGILIYGGDLRKDGFTEFLMAEAAALQNRVKVGRQSIENRLAWPIYIDNDELLRIKADHNKWIKIVEVPPALDIKQEISKTKRLPCDTPKNRYIWSRCLTRMREMSIKNSFARVCAGGKLAGYKGKMPGVLEEIEIALAYDRMPLYLCGGFGGVVGEVCQTISTGHGSTALTEEWQTLNNVGYKDVQEIARKYRREARYAELMQKLQKKGLIKELSNRSGLSVAEYSRVMVSPFIDECIHLILKGLSKIATRT